MRGLKRGTAVAGSRVQGSDAKPGTNVPPSTRARATTARLEQSLAGGRISSRGEPSGASPSQAVAGAAFAGGRGFGRLDAWPFAALAAGVGLLTADFVLIANERRPVQTGGWIATLAFALLAAAALRRGRGAAALLAGLFAIYGGLSAVLATAPSQNLGTEVPASLVTLRNMGVISAVTDAVPADGIGPFRYALSLTCACGLAAVCAAWLAAGLGSRRRQTTAVRLEPRSLARAGKLLVSIGYAGFLAAAVRFVVTTEPYDNVWTSIKSLWTGGSYFLLVATFAIPGFGLWLHAALLDRSRWRELRRFAAAVIVYIAFSAATGQRGFLIQLALVAICVLLWHRLLTPPRLAVIAVAGIAILGVSQAVRDAELDTGRLDLGSVATHLSPSHLPGLDGSQLASFRWTWDEARYREQLKIPNTFVSALLKPVPRQLLRHKVQGFGNEFTREVYPDAANAGVSFATPLVAEADYSFGFGGAIAVLALLGLAAGSGERAIRRHRESLLQPILAGTLVWCCYAFVRGDFANALVFSAAWILPVVGLYFALVNGRTAPKLGALRRGPQAQALG